MNLDLPACFLADLPPEASLTSTLITEACHTLKRNRHRHLATRTTQQVIELLSRVSLEWQDPAYSFRKLALELGPASTGFSPATLAAGLDAFFRSITRDSLEALIEQDLGHPERLDRFVASPSGQRIRRSSRARGPELIVHIAAGNLPVPALMSMMLGLLVRSAQFIKCASNAALLPRLFAHSLYESDSRIGSCLEIAAWPGGRTELESALFSTADCVTATGSDDMLAQVRLGVPASVRFLGYGSRVSFGYVARESLTCELIRHVAAGVAADVAAWDQFGCLSPHQIFVENAGAVPPDLFAQILSEELGARQAIEPRGGVDTATAAALTTRRQLYEVRAAASDNTRIWQSAGSTAWTVVYEAEATFNSSPLARFIHVCAVSDLDETLRVMETVRGKVSTAALEAAGDRAQQLAWSLAEWGVTRICPVGRMQLPPPAWRHDGRPALEDLVTWTDWEH